MIFRTSPRFDIDMIITSDWHLMEKERNPPCRLDSHWEAQWDKVDQIKTIQMQNDCDIFNAGDIFEHYKASPFLINQCIERFPHKMRCLIGNHDSPERNAALIEKSAWDTLFRSDIINGFATQGDWGTPLNKIGPIGYKNRRIVLFHDLIWKNNIPFPGCEAPRVKKIFRMFKNADLIISGHNHETFYAQNKNQILINPGSLTRHKADQINHKPCIFLYNAKNNSFKIHYLEIKKDVISREHLEIKNRKDNEEQKFLMKLKKGWKIDLSFEKNIEIAIIKNKVPKSLQTIIFKWLNKSGGIK